MFIMPFSGSRLDDDLNDEMYNDGAASANSSFVTNNEDETCDVQKVID